MASDLRKVLEKLFPPIKSIPEMNARKEVFKVVAIVIKAMIADGLLEVTKNKKGGVGK